MQFSNPLVMDPLLGWKSGRGKGKRGGSGVGILCTVGIQGAANLNCTGAEGSLCCGFGLEVGMVGFVDTVLEMEKLSLGIEIDPVLEIRYTN